MGEESLYCDHRKIYTIDMLFNQTVKYDYGSDPLSYVFMALADQTRRSILERLAISDMTVNEIAAVYDMSLPAISKHLKILERAGLISQTREAQYRPRHIELKAFVEAICWLQTYKIPHN